MLRLDGRSRAVPASSLTFLRVHGTSRGTVIARAVRYCPGGILVRRPVRGSLGDPQLDIVEELASQITRRRVTVPPFPDALDHARPPLWRRGVSEKISISQNKIREKNREVRLSYSSEEAM